VLLGGKLKRNGRRCVGGAARDLGERARQLSRLAVSSRHGMRKGCLAAPVARVGRYRRAAASVPSSASASRRPADQQRPSAVWPRATEDLGPKQFSPRAHILGRLFSTNATFVPPTPKPLIPVARAIGLPVNQTIRTKTGPQQFNPGFALCNGNGWDLAQAWKSRPSLIRRQRPRLHPGGPDIAL